MGIFDHLIAGFGVVLTPMNIFYCSLGCLVGTLVGVLPGIGPLAALSMLLPVTFKLPAISSIIMLTGIFYGTMYGGSTTSILVNIPGEAASVVTCIDGHQMAKHGRAGAALGIAAIGSFIAGTISTIGLNFFSPLLVIVALKFGPPEFFALMTLSFVICIFMVSGSMLKGIAMLALGLLVAVVGMDPVFGNYRFHFGTPHLMSGFDLIPVIMGLFGISEIFINIEESLKREVLVQKVRNIYPKTRDLLDTYRPIFRGSFLGFIFGLLPGGGPVTASFISYAVEKRVSKRPEAFGAGAIEGVAGPEAANNSAVAASMVPLLSLGLPCNAVTAILLGALVMNGVQPGPMLMSQNPDIFWGVIASMYLGNFMLLIMNLPLIGVWIQFLRIPYPILFPLIILLCFVGTYSANLRVFDLWVMMGFGLAGYMLRKLDYELGPFILAMVLAPLFEQSLRQSLIMSNGSFMIFMYRGISCSLLALTVLLLIFYILGKYRCTQKIYNLLRRA